MQLIDIDEGKDWGDCHWELTDCRPELTGLPGWVFVCVKFPHMNHDAILRFSKQRLRFINKPGLWLGISIPDNDTPEVVTAVPHGIAEDEIEQVKQWIVLNRKILRDHWFGRCDSAVLCESLQAV